MAALREGEAVEFGTLRNLLELTDGNLGAHLRRLEEQGYIDLDKTFVDRKPRTFVRLTGTGRRAFKSHIAALEAILGKNV